MKRTLTLLTFLLTSSMANINISANTSSLQHIDTEKKSEMTTREVRTSRNVRPNREVRKNRNVKAEATRGTPSLRLSRVSREIREDRLIVQKTRESRKMPQVIVQDTLYFATVK